MKKRNPWGLRLLIVAAVVVMIVGTATYCAGSIVDEAANSGRQDRSETRPEPEPERAEFVPMAAEGMSQRLAQREIAAASQAEEKHAPVAVRYELGDVERDYIERVVMAEAGAEDYDGQCLVAQCIIGTMEARDMTALEVVQEPRQYAAPAATVTDSVKEAVDAVFCQGYRVTSEPVRFFYAPRFGYSAWHENGLVFVLEHGGHRFFKEG